MLNLKIVILLVGVFLMTLGYVNNVKTSPIQKNMYKIFPRNVYDEIFFSLPLLNYDDKLYNKMNPVYILEDASDYRTLFEKDTSTYVDRYGAYKDFEQKVEDVKYFNEEEGGYKLNNYQ